jgi:nucleoside-diphosphate-sugar epimerase
MKILITGGAGYLGSVLSLHLLDTGHHVRVLDSLMHGSRGLLPLLGHPRFTFVRGDIRKPGDVASALADVQAVVHLAAIVGDPACARDPELAREVNEVAANRLLAEAERAAVLRFVFASTCSNYGRMADTSIAATETHELRPVSLYAETKVVMEQRVLAQGGSPMSGTVLRFATLFGPSPRMRFDLTVNQFVKEMLLDRALTVFGEQFWRPYVHVREAARAIGLVLTAPRALVAGQVFNVGHSDENYRKQDLIEIIRPYTPDVDVRSVSVADDPRDYRVSFERIRTTLGFEPAMRVPDGVGELVDALSGRMFGQLDDPAFSNTPVRTASPVAPEQEEACAR